ncbi:hypothetical protein V6N13_087814 [Hibiscus sabdariffa]|uniref:Uncharacterized protein n=1 Tax=Hibiscus sabdariffa TaxID=183260 RepID=A0ABR2FXE5_9ROSI
MPRAASQKHSKVRFEKPITQPLQPCEGPHHTMPPRIPYKPFHRYLTYATPQEDASNKFYNGEYAQTKHSPVLPTDLQRYTLAADSSPGPRS